MEGWIEDRGGSANAASQRLHSCRFAGGCAGGGLQGPGFALSRFGAGRATPSFSAKVETKGLVSGPFLRPRVGQGGKPGGTLGQSEGDGPTEPVLVLTRLGCCFRFLFYGLRGGNNQSGTGFSSIPDIFFGHRLVQFPHTLWPGHFKQPGSLLRTLCDVAPLSWGLYKTKRCQFVV